MKKTFYETYVSFKQWEQDEDSDRPEDYAAVLAFGAAGKSGRLLDIGCGRAGLLDWAKAHGFQTFGTEVIPELVHRAAGRGHAMIDPRLTGEIGPFDTITALDVLEHLTLDQCAELFAAVRRLLAPEGRFIARFPNGQSPFSGMWQHGDLTHIQILTPSAVRQLAAPQGLKMIGAYNPRSIPPGLRGLKRRAVHLVRDLIETIIGYTYFGARVPMDPNILVVLGRID